MKFNLDVIFTDTEFKELKELSKIKVFATIMIENIPQIILQGIFILLREFHIFRKKPIFSP